MKDDTQDFVLPMKDAKFRSLEDWREQYEPWTVHKPDLAAKTDDEGPTTEQMIAEYILIQVNIPKPRLESRTAYIYSHPPPVCSSSPNYTRSCST